MLFTGSIDSDYVGRGDFASRVFFSVELEAEELGPVYVWGRDLESYTFRDLPEADQRKISECILEWLKDLKAFNGSYESWLDEQRRGA